MKTREEMLNRLSPARREAVEKRTQELILKEKVLRNVRKDQGLSQKAVADAMGIGQDSVSRLERRGDCLVSTMRDYVEAMGGELQLVAKFPGVDPVEIVAEDMAELGAEDPSEPANCNGLEAKPVHLTHF